MATIKTIVKLHTHSAISSITNQTDLIRLYHYSIIEVPDLSWDDQLEEGEELIYEFSEEHIGTAFRLLTYEQMLNYLNSKKVYDHKT